MSNNKVVEIPIVIKNYKKIVSLNTVLVGGPLFMFTGPNDVGKTTMLQILEAIMCVKDDNKDCVTKGQKEGFVEGTIPAADGKDYRYRYDFNVEGKKKFTFIDPVTNKKIKKISDIRKIFNYTGFSATDFFTWSGTKEGREKQKALIMGLLSEKELDAIKVIDSKIKSGEGTLYLERTTVYNDLQAAKKNIEVLTEQDKGFIGKNDAAVEQKTKYETQRSKYQVKVAGIDTRIELKESKIKDVTTAEEAIEKIKTEERIQLASLDEDILNLEKKLKAKKDARLVFTQSLPAVREQHAQTLDKAKIALEEFNKEGVDSKEELEIKIKTLDQKILAGGIFITNVALADAKDTRIKKNDKVVIDKQAEYDLKTVELSNLKSDKDQIISNSENIPQSISINDDGITVDGFEFNEKSLSLSGAIKACIKLMMKINKDAKVLLVGDAESIGDPILKEIQQMAIDEDKILFFAEHDRRAEKFEINIYDELADTPTKKAIKDLKSDKKKEPESLF